MNGKNIKKALEKKLNDWIETVEVESIKKAIRKDAIITGGAIVSMLTGEEVHDYDVYFRTLSTCNAVAVYYADKFNAAHPQGRRVKIEQKDGKVKCFIRSSGVAEDDESGAAVTDETEPFAAESEEPVAAVDADAKPRYRPVFFSTNAIMLSDKIQIVIRFYGEPEEIHKNYDFVHCTCSYDLAKNKLELPARALEAIINKELIYVGSLYPVCSIIRTRKFITRGWHINAGQYLKMCLQVSDLDLKDFETFKDQITGVDSLYFAEAIAKIDEMRKKDPTFLPDTAYLFDVINKIF